MRRLLSSIEQLKMDKLPGKYDQELFDEVKKYSTSTSKAIKEIVVAQKTSNALDCIMAFSQDPIRKVEKLDQLLKKDHG